MEKPPAYRPAARQPQRPLDRHALETFTRIFTDRMERCRADLITAAESEAQLIRQEIGRITDIIEEINSEGIKPSMLNAYISEVQAAESFRRHIRQFAWAFGQGEADPAEALNNARKSSIKGTKAEVENKKRGEKSRKITPEIKADIQRRYVELDATGEYTGQKEALLVQLAADFSVSVRTIRNNL